jgi:hypothetical protein
MKKQLLKKIYTFIPIFIGMFSSGSNAQIVYTDIPDSARTASYNLDLNNDGITDFVITHSTSPATGACYGAKTNNYIKVTPSGNNQVVDYSSASATKIAVNILIDASTLTWGGTSNQLMSSLTWTCIGMAHTPPSWHGHPAGQWYNAIDGYLGVKLKKNGNTYYGWVRISISGANSFTVKDYAYDSTPNHSIVISAMSGARLSEEINLNSADFSLITYPNPLSNSATISFSLLQSENISLKIFDLHGRLISTLADNIFEAGENELVWNANEINAGVYFLQLQSKANLQVQKLIVTK